MCGYWPPCGCLTLIATLLAIWLKISTALTETVKAFKYEPQEGIYYTLMMSTGLTFGTISALFGLNNGIINGAQYSCLVATVIASAVVPTMVTNKYFLLRHLLVVKPAEAYGTQPGVTPAESE